MYGYLTGENAISYKTEDGFEITREVDRRSIGQFTGLYDKNGKEIYENSILRCCFVDENGKSSHKEIYNVRYFQVLAVLLYTIFMIQKVILFNLLLQRFQNIMWK